MTEYSELTRDQIRTAYKECFTTFPPGKIVIADLERHARASKIDRDAVNAMNCVYRVAQQDLVIYIQRMMLENEPKQTEMKNGRTSRTISTSD